MRTKILGRLKRGVWNTASRWITSLLAAAFVGSAWGDETTMQNGTVAIVYAANGEEIGQYTSVADAIAAGTTVSGCTVLVLDGTHDCGSSTIAIDKSITLTGQSKADTVLNFTANGNAAFSVQASNVTIKDMTINQADKTASNTTHIQIGSKGAVVEDVTVQGVKFTGSKYSLSVYARNLTVDSCDFVEPGSDAILLYTVQGTSVISANTFVQTTPNGQGFIYGTVTDGTDPLSSGSLTISGNTASGGRCFYHCNNQNRFDTTAKMTLAISGNEIIGYNNKAIVFAEHSDVSLGSIFNSITIAQNAFYTTANRPTIQRDDADRSSLSINASGNYWGAATPDFDNLIPGTSDKYLIMPHDASNVAVDSWYQAYDATTDTLSSLYVVPVPVAQIVHNDVPGQQYTTLQAAVDAAYEMTGDVTISLLADTTEKVVVKQKQGLNLTIDGDGNTLRGQFLVKGMDNDGSRTDTLTIKGFAFTGTAADLNASSENGYITFLGAAGNNHAHNVTVTNCTFTSIDTSAAYEDRPALRSLSTGLDNITLIDLHAQNLHSFAQFFYATNVVISGCSLSASKHGMSINLVQNGTAVISNTSIHPTSSSSYGIRLQGEGYGVVTLLAGTDVDAVKALVAGNNTSGNVPLNNGNFLVEDGFYNGTLAQDKETCTFYITGGYFSVEPDATFIAPGYTVVDNTDPATKDAYPYTVGVVPPVAAVITNNGATTNTYETFAEAISAARANGGTVALLADIDVAGGTSTGYNMSDITLDGQGYTITCACGVLFSGTNVVVSNLKVEMGASGNHIMTVTSGTFTGCEFVGASGVKSVDYADDKSGVAKTLTFSYCTFRDFTTDNAVLNDDESNANSQLVVDHCTFSNTVRVAILQRADTFTNNTVTDFAKFTANNTGVVMTGNTFDKGTRNGVMKMYQKPAEISGNDFSAAGVFENNNTSTMTEADPLNLVNNTWGDYDKSTLPVGIIAELPSYIAQIIRNNAVFAQYETLALAIAAAVDGDTIELLTDIQLSGTEQVAINKVGTYVIDGKGFAITPASDAGYVYERFKFGMDGEASNFAKSYTITNLTITGFTDSTYFIRNEGCSATFVDCTITNNNLSAQSNSRLVLATASNMTMKDCLVADNTTASYLVDFNTNGSSNGTVGTLDIDGCLFDGNTVGGSGLVYTYGSSSGGDAIRNSTFSGNTVNSAAAAIVYFSGATDVTGCFFTNNTVTATDATQKCGILALGSGAAGIDIAANVFVDNTVASGGAKATVYVGATNVDLTGNYWGGSAPVVDNGADVYIYSGKSATYENYAVAYAVNENGRGVTVTLYVPPVAQIVETGAKYETLAAAIAEVQDGETIELLADVTGETVTVIKSVTITGASDAEGNPAITLENTQLTLSGAMVELAVTNLAFTGSSYINANNGKALTVDHVTAVVNPTKLTGRSAFIVVSGQENTTGLDLTVTHSTIVNTFGTDSYGAAIFGWAYLNSATICDNVLGSDSYRFRFIAVKLMNAVDGATYTIERNTVYGTNAYFGFYGFDLYQNNSRNNSYTAVSKDNVFDVTATGSNDLFVFDIERNGNASTKTIVIDSGSTLNGEAVTLNDFLNELNVNAGFYGAGVVYDANGMMTAGTFNRAFSDEELAEFVAEDLRSIAVGDGTYTLDVPVAQIGTTKYETLQAAIADAVDGDTIELLCNIELSGTETVEINKVGTYTIDGKGFSITPANDSAYIYQRFKFGESGQAYTDTKNYIVKNLTISGFTNSTYFVRTEGCCLAFEDCTITNNTLAGQVNSRLMLNTHADFTLDGCVIADNSAADSLIDFNSNADNDGANALVVNNCLFENNTNGGVAVIQIAEDRSVVVTDSTFEGNTVNAVNNGAVVYFGDVGGDCTGCLFKDNIINYTVSDVTEYGNRVRVAGAIFTWAKGDDPGTISGNAFVNNSVVKQNANFLECYAKAIYSGGYYNPQDLAGNYFGGSAPVIGQADETTSNNDIYAEYSSKEITASTYATSYTLNDDNYGVTVTLYVPPVAQIVDGDAYTTLQAAVDAAESGDTIIMIANTMEGVTIPGGKAVVIDLNGKTVSYASGTPTITVSATGSLTVDDSSENASGCIKNTVANGVAIYCDAGSVTVDNGTVGSLDTYRGIVVDHVGTVVVNDGSVIASNAAIRSTATAHDVITINGGTIGAATTDCAVYDYDYATIAIHGGVLNADKNAIAAFGSTLTIDGGEINRHGNAASNYAILLGEGGTATISSGTITSGNSCIYVGDNGTTLNITGGTITAAGEATILTNGTKDEAAVINISGGTVANIGTESAIYQPNRGTTVNVSGNAVVTGPTGIILKGGTLNISGGSISGTGVHRAPAVNDNGGTSTGDAVYVEDTYSTNGNYKPTVNITGGTMTSANGYAAQYYTHVAAVTENKANGSISIAGAAVLGSNKQTDVMASTTIPNKVLASGGFFAHVVTEDYCADGYICVPNTDAKTSAAYPYTVVPAVAQIGDVKYASFEEAIADVQDGETIVVLGYDSETMVAPEGWKFVTENDVTTLVKKVYVAQIVTNEGTTTNKYESLRQAASVAQSGDTIEMVADDRVSFADGSRLTIDKPITITGATNDDGTPKYTIYGHPTDITPGRNIILVTPTTSAYVFTVSNLAFSEFGNASSGTEPQQAIIYVSQNAAEGTVVALSNLKFNKFNRRAICVYKHTITVDGCEIDCAKEGNHLTKGISLNNGATATITKTRIRNSGNTYAGWDAGAIESLNGCTLNLDNCTITSSENGVIIQGDDGSGWITITDTTIEASDRAVASTGEDIIISIGSGMFTGNIDVRGEWDQETYYPGSYLEIEDGIFNGKVRVDEGYEDMISVFGGYFAEYIVPEYCASGYLCTTRPVKDELYQVVPAETVTYTLAGGDPEGAALPSPASFAYPSGDMAEIALTPATCTDGDYTFAGWKVSGEGDAIAALPAGTTGNITLVATWTGVKTVTITESATDVPIKVTDEWLEANSLDTADTTTIQDALNKEEANGNKAWENYVLGLDGSDPNAKLAADAAQGPVSATPITSNVDVPSVDTGFTVEYKLVSVDTNGTVVTESALQPTPDLTADIAAMTSETNVVYYKTVAVITSTTDPNVTVEVPSTNTIGVLKVESDATTTAVAVPWASYDGTNDISVADIVRTANLTPGDELKAYAPDGKYKAWKLNASKEWEPMTVVGGSSEADADAYKVKRGSAVWLTRADPSQPIYLVGGVAATEKVSVALEPKKGDNDPSWNLVAPSGTEPVDIAELLGDGATADRVSVPTAYVPKEYEYVDGKGWGYWESVTYTDAKGRKRVKREFRTGDTAVPAGTGFWYLNGGDAKSIDL